ncbi:VOC family protein [Corticicoccus populi]|uniref:VOC family protein n=1 Tax=Corticicoccus populi TaxID=1812821 RepID=A0ABW5WZ59_9STAP
MHGGIHHIEIYTGNLNQSREFYSNILGKLGYTLYQEWEEGFSLKLGSTYIVFVQAEEKYLINGYHRKNIGLNHLAFSVSDTESVDELRQYLIDSDIPLLYDGEYPYAGGGSHYAVYFEDPDRIKLEIAAEYNE